MLKKFDKINLDAADAASAKKQIRACSSVWPELLTFNQNVVGSTPTGPTFEIAKDVSN